MYYQITSLLGLLSFIILFFSFFENLLFSKKKESGVENKCGTKNLRVSVIIPARNEGENLKFLLKDLSSQKTPVYEIICVDDNSEDDTFSVANSFNMVTVLKSNRFSGSGNGKAYACIQGAEKASGEVLLFLDADVRLSALAVQKLIEYYKQERCTLSVQPYHNTEKLYEKLSYFFNLVQLGANGCCGVKSLKTAGLFGPVIMIDRGLYNKIGGHRCAKGSVVDDLELGRELERHGEKYALLTGDEHVRFRMYSNGVRALSQGWTKNIATGAGYASPTVFILTFLWITGSASAVLAVGDAIIFKSTVGVICSFFSYIAYVVAQGTVARKIANFGVLTSLVYPLWLVFFTVLFVVSAIRKLFKVPTVWKGRRIL